MDQDCTGITLNQTQQGSTANSTDSSNQAMPDSSDHAMPDSSDHAMPDSSDQAMPDLIISVRSSEEGCVSGERENSGAEVCNALGASKVSVEEAKIKGKEADERPHVIDVKCGKEGFDENWNEEKVCRICHLTSEQSDECTSDLVPLGCGCKNELGVAHIHCAEAWFKLKGNRLCEICGETAKSVTGVGDNRFMEEWNENGQVGRNANSSERTGSCWRGPTFCNFLMACLVIAFVLPWFFRVNMF